MKIAIIFTEKEVKDTEDNIMRDPCEHIECADLDCDNCPLREYVRNLRKAQEQFIDVLNSMPTEGAE